MAKATLTISSKNYSSWSLRGWLLTKFSGLEFDEIVTAPDDASARAEILLLSSSILVPCLRHEGATVWDTLAIAEYLNEVMPDAGLLPADRILRAHCRSICGEIHSGFTTLRASLPVNLKGHFPELQDLVACAGRHRPGLQHLARMPGQIRRTVPVRRTQHGGRHVCAGRDSLHDLRRQAGTAACGLCRHDHGVAGNAANGSRPPRPSRPISRSSRSNIRQCRRAIARLKGSSTGHALLNLMPSGVPRGRDNRPGDERTQHSLNSNFEWPSSSFTVVRGAARQNRRDAARLA